MSLGTRCGKSPFSRQVDVVGWAAFFIRIGIAELGGIGWAWALLGISEIVLSVQVILWLNDEGTTPSCGKISRLTFRCFGADPSETSTEGHHRCRATRRP